MNTTVDILLYLLKLDIEEAIQKNTPVEEVVSKRFNAFVEFISPVESDMNFDNLIKIINE